MPVSKVSGPPKKIYIMTVALTLFNANLPDGRYVRAMV